jgi:hypothetical protein
MGSEIPFWPRAYWLVACLSGLPHGLPSLLWLTSLALVEGAVWAVWERKLKSWNPRTLPNSKVDVERTFTGFANPDQLVRRILDSGGWPHYELLGAVEPIVGYGGTQADGLVWTCESLTLWNGLSSSRTSSPWLISAQLKGRKSKQTRYLDWPY